MPENLRHSLLLLITATIWGTGFVAQARSMEHISPFAFTWGRSVIGAAFVPARHDSGLNEKRLER